MLADQKLTTLAREVKTNVHAKDDYSRGWGLEGKTWQEVDDSIAKTIYIKANADLKQKDGPGLSLLKVILERKFL